MTGSAGGGSGFKNDDLGSLNEHIFITNQNQHDESVESLPGNLKLATFGTQQAFKDHLENEQIQYDKNNKLINHFPTLEMPDQVGSSTLIHSKGRNNETLRKLRNDSLSIPPAGRADHETTPPGLREFEDRASGSMTSK